MAPFLVKVAIPRCNCRYHSRSFVGTSRHCLCESRQSRSAIRLVVSYYLSAARTCPHWSPLLYSTSFVGVTIYCLFGTSKDISIGPISKCPWKNDIWTPTKKWKSSSAPLLFLPFFFSFLIFSGCIITCWGSHHQGYWSSSWYHWTRSSCMLVLSVWCNHSLNGDDSFRYTRWLYLR